MTDTPQLLVGSSNHIYLIDLNIGEVRSILERERRKKWWFFDDSSKGFFGICRQAEQTILVAAREKLGTPSAGKPATDTRLHHCDLIQGYSRALCDVLDVHDVHQIESHRELVYLTDTGKNRVVVADQKTGRIRTLLNVGSERQDISHINAVADQYLYVGLNNRGDKDAQVLKLPLSSVQPGEYDLLDPAVQVEVIPLEGCRHTHDLLLDGNRIMFCASHDGKIHYQDQEQPFFTSSLWLRGLAVTPDRVWVGVSQKADRSKRHSAELSGEVIEIDKISGKEMRRFHLPGAGQVNDLLLMAQ